MKVFVTGATGFIGSYLVQRLVERGHEPRCLVRASSRACGLKQNCGRCFVGDLTDRDSVRAAMRGCEAVIDLGGLYSFWQPDRRIFAAVNVDGTRYVMEAALELGVSKVVHVSTAGIFGKPSDRPFTEKSAPATERPSDYFRTKYRGDLIAWDLYEKKGLPLVVVYPGMVLGRGDPKASGEYLKALVNGKLPASVFPDTVMTCVHVRDVAEVILRALEKEGNIGERYLAGAENFTFGQLNCMVHDIAGVPVPKMRMPGSMAYFMAAVLTGWANIRKRPPAWGLSNDQVRVMKTGFQFDGSKAARELGIKYAPVREAVKEEIESFR